jgi:hypothetical protein
VEKENPEEGQENQEGQGEQENIKENKLYIYGRYSNFKKTK